MLSWLEHMYRYVEVYTVILTWVTVPLGFFACYLFFQRHYGMFLPVQNDEHSTQRGSDAAN